MHIIYRYIAIIVHTMPSDIVMHIDTHCYVGSVTVIVVASYTCLSHIHDLI